MNTKRYQKLRNFIDESKYSHKEVADMIGITPARFSQKINRNKSDFTLQEASLLCYILDLNMNEFFYNPDVPKTGINKILS